VDQFFPEVGESTVRVLRHLGVEVDFPRGQTCCGQPAFNTGYHRDAAAVARRFLDIFEGDGYVVAPSGSCVSMVRLFYPELFREEAHLHQRALRLAQRTYELSEFLVKVVGVHDIGARLPHGLRVTYHDSCHALRELGIAEGPRRLIRGIRGVEFVEFLNHEACCGFGGTFAVKYPDISAAILQEKVDGIARSGTDAVVSTDCGCLMNIAGAMSRRGISVRPIHLAQLLALGLGG
jgi:L-lactate dehydrogenase complex protein LldE